MAVKKVTIALNATDKTAKAFAGVNKRLAKAKAAIGKGFTIGAKLAVGALAGAAALGAVVKSAANAGDKIDKMRQKIGVSAEFLSQLDHAAKLSGTSLDAMGSMIGKLGKSAFDADRGSKKLSDTFSELGIEINDSNGKMKDSETLFRETIKALSGMTDETKKGAIAQQLFGRSGRDLLPMLNGGVKGLNAMMQEAKDLGYTWSNETAAGAAAFNDSLTRVETIIGGITDSIGMKLAPKITEIVDKFNDWYKANRQIVDSAIDTYIGKINEALGDAYQQVKKWADDGSFLLWWEQIKAGILGVKVVLDGIMSAIDFALAGFAKMMAYSLKLQNVGVLKYMGLPGAALSYVLGDKDKDERIRQADEYSKMADKYTKSGVKRSQATVADYAAQAQKVAAMSVAVDARREGNNIGAAMRQAAQQAVNEVKAGVDETLRDQNNQRSVLAGAAGAY
jgi:hypothetical protein